MQLTFFLRKCNNLMKVIHLKNMQPFKQTLVQKRTMNNDNDNDKTKKNNACRDSNFKLFEPKF